MEPNERFADLGPGLHVLRESEPLKRAGFMAAQMRAELCATLPQADAALAERSSLPPIDVATLATLQVLSRRVARAERIAARTRERAVLEVGERLAATGSGLAIHPTHGARTGCRRRSRPRRAGRGGARPGRPRGRRSRRPRPPRPPRRHASPKARTDADEDGPGSSATRVRRAGPPPIVRRSRSLGALVSSFGVVLLVLGFGVLPLWAALLFPLGVSLWAMRYLRPREEDDVADRQEASTLLAEVAATTDDVFGPRRLSRELADRTMQLDVTRDRAEEEVRVAERSWHELAGADADVADLEAVIKRLDPQHEDAHLVASETVGVKATDVVLHQFRQRWSAFWR